MNTPPHPEHGVEELCDAGLELYARALREGHVTGKDAEKEAPCLIGFGLLHPDPCEPWVLRPVAPATALHRLLRTSAARVAEERRLETLLLEEFEPLIRIDGRCAADAEASALRLVSGTEQINQAITDAMGEASLEVLCIQPSSHYADARGEAAQAVAMRRDQDLLDRGGRIRALYQHTQRHRPLVLSRYEQLRGDAQARTLDEITDRLLLVDRTVAFIPANADRSLALEIRHPALISFLRTVFDRLWRLATPMYPETVTQPTRDGVTPRQRAIAALLVEGHTDAVIADRLGMNVRTARVHIAKLAATLGSESRAQLGYLIGRSGILDPEG
ncbi:LuxR C-terminal-related transcriptional regulator [Streptomyces sp. NPDC003401]